MFFFKKLPSKQKKYFVSVGAGENQLPLIQAAKKRGFSIIGVDISTSAPGLVLCDYRIQESIYDYESVYSLISEALLNGEICGIMTRSFGQAVVTTAFLCGKFGLPFLPFEKALIFQDKQKIIKLFQDAGIRMAETFTLRSISSKNTVFPVVIKPAEGHGKENVYKINSRSELKKIQQTLPKNRKFFYEKYITGKEIIAVGYIHRGHFYLVDVTDKEFQDENSFSDKMHVSPSVFSDLAPEISGTGQIIADTCSIESSPLIMEFRVDENRDLWLIEAVPEFGGEFLADKAIPSVLGYSLIDEAVSSHTGGRFRIPVRKKRKAYAVRYLSAEEGILESFNSQAVLKNKKIIFFKMFRQPGEKNIKASVNMDRTGVLIAKASSPEKAAALAEKGEKEADIRVTK